MSRRPRSASDRAASLETLREMLTPGTDVYVVQRSRARSGMSRRLSLFVIRPGAHIRGEFAAGDNPAPDPQDYYLQSITWHVANVTGWNLNENRELLVTGGGMDMHFHTVYTLGRHLWPNGIGGDSHAGRDGGYALNAVTL